VPSVRVRYVFQELVLSFCIFPSTIGSSSYFSTSHHLMFVDICDVVHLPSSLELSNPLSTTERFFLSGCGIPLWIYGKLYYMPLLCMRKSPFWIHIHLRSSLFSHSAPHLIGHVITIILATKFGYNFLSKLSIKFSVVLLSCNSQIVINIWSCAPDGARHQDRMTD
jgi:hypothetical protein